VNALLIAGASLREASRKRLLLLAVIFSLVFLVVFTVGFELLLQRINQPAAAGRMDAMDRLLPAIMTILGLYAVNFLTGLSAIFISVNAISGEVESGTAHAILARPIRRRDLIVGKWLGYAAVLTVYVIAISVALLGIVYVTSSYLPPSPIQAIGMMVLVALSLLSLSIFGGTFLPTLANGITVFLLYGVAWLGGMIEVIGTALDDQVMQRVGVIVSLIIPSDILWRGASYYLQPTSMLLLQNASPGGGPPFIAATPPSAPMVIWVFIYIVGLLLLSIFTFNRRDL
jgi:Cu-processing system permease protein